MVGRTNAVAGGKKDSQLFYVVDNIGPTSHIWMEYFTPDGELSSVKIDYSPDLQDQGNAVTLDTRYPVLFTGTGELEDCLFISRKDGRELKTVRTEDLFGGWVVAVNFLDPAIDPQNAIAITYDPWQARHPSGVGST